MNSKTRFQTIQFDARLSEKIRWGITRREYVRTILNCLRKIKDTIRKIFLWSELRWTRFFSSRQRFFGHNSKRVRLENLKMCPPYSAKNLLNKYVLYFIIFEEYMPTIRRWYICFGWSRCRRRCQLWQ